MRHIFHSFTTKLEYLKCSNEGYVIVHCLESQLGSGFEKHDKPNAILQKHCFRCLMNQINAKRKTQNVVASKLVLPSSSGNNLTVKCRIPIF